MPSPLEPEQGPFLSFLHWLDRFGQVPMNALQGKWGAAGRQAADILGEIPDAFLPGNLIPDASTSADDTTASELFGLDENTSPWIRTPLDIVGGTLLNPTTYIPGAAILRGLGAGGKLARAGVDALGGGEALDAAGQTVRRTFGAQRLSPEVDDMLARGVAAGENAAKAQTDAARGIFEGSGLQPREDLFNILNDIAEQGGRTVRAGVEQPRNPLYDIAKTTEELTPFLGDTERIIPANDLVNIKKSQPARPAIDEIDSAVGIEGVAPQLDLPYANNALGRSAKGMLDSVDPGVQMNAIAQRVLGEAYPLAPSDPRYASGIDLANRAYGAGPGRLKAYGEELPTIRDRSVMGGDEARSAKVIAEGAGPSIKSELSLGVDDPLTGAPLVRRAGPQTVELPSTLGRVNEMLGGAPAELARQAVTSAPEVGASFARADDQVRGLVEAIQKQPWDEARKAAAIKLVDPYIQYAQRGYRDLVENKAYFKPAGIDPLLESPANYAQRKYTGFTEAGDQELLGSPALLKERTLGNGQQLADFLDANPELTLERDLAKAAFNRAGQHGQLVQRATIGRDLIEKAAKDAKARQLKGEALSETDEKAIAAQYKTLADKEFTAATSSIIEDMAKASPEDAQVLRDAMKGMAPRGAATAALTKLNSYFKPFAVYGAFIPKVGSVVRNMTGSMWVAMANAETRKHLGTALREFVPNFLRSVDDGIEKVFGVRFSRNEFAEVEQAFRESGGISRDAIARIKDPTMREAVAAGLFGNNFVTSEQLISEATRHGWRKFFHDWKDMPGVIFKGSEQRIRYGFFKSMRAAGLPAERAAKQVRDTFFDYRISSKENRLARDLIPFFQFPAKAIPQQAKFLAAHPPVAVGAAQVFGQGGDDQPRYDWLAQQASIPVGQDAQGNPQYLSSLGLPLEALTKIPGFSGRDIEQDLIGSSQPLLKTAYAAVAGHDPMFGTPYGSYDKTPLTGGIGSEFGRYYQMAKGTGVIQPLTAPLDIADNFLDDRKSTAEKLLQFGTGARFASVDPDVYARQQAEKYLQSRPDVRKYTGYYGGDVEADAAMQQLKDAKAKIKAKMEKAKQGIL